MIRKSRCHGRRQVSKQASDAGKHLCRGGAPRGFNAEARLCQSLRRSIAAEQRGSSCLWGRAVGDDEAFTAAQAAQEPQLPLQPCSYIGATAEYCNLQQLPTTRPGPDRLLLHSP